MFVMKLPTAGGSVHRLSPVKFRPVSGPELDLPDNIIADLSSDKLLLYQLTRAVRTGNISAKEACKKIGPLNHARLKRAERGDWPLYPQALAAGSHDPTFAQLHAC
ncbi:hypothetical protein FJT64_001835 [Amphibalanus amphitrite]|uniref:Uncharacterized protein n=1 Tax=Amphibalanus amphitrite TaxID=1232801 RepID=A0A6A4WWH7_AMPAM|nr:hypothetical protein FJT64_001835 [Amphibalanus amphitrite]